MRSRKSRPPGGPPPAKTLAPGGNAAAGTYSSRSRSTNASASGLPYSFRPTTCRCRYRPVGSTSAAPRRTRPGHLGIGLERGRRARRASSTAGFAAPPGARCRRRARSARARPRRPRVEHVEAPDRLQPLRDALVRARARPRGRAPARRARAAGRGCAAAKGRAAHDRAREPRPEAALLVRRRSTIRRGTSRTRSSRAPRQ